MMNRTHKSSRKLAIEQHCKACIYDPVGGTGSWRQQAANCTSKNCALWPFRPTPYPKSISLGKAVSDAESVENRMISSKSGG